MQGRIRDDCCPVCGSELIDRQNYPEDDYGFVHHGFTCRYCNSSFVFTYALSEVSITDIGGTHGQKAIR